MSNNIRKLIDLLNIDDYKKEILKNRYLYQVKLYEKKAKISEVFYLFLSLIITIGSIILPALLSIQEIEISDNQETNKQYKQRIYWSTWSISLLITISNGIIQLLSLNKQYLSYNTTREKLIAEGWHYLELSGDYENDTHDSAFNEFCEEIESIKKNQVDKEMLFVNFKSLYKKKQTELRNANNMSSVDNTNIQNNNNDLEESSDDDGNTYSNENKYLIKKNVNIL